MAGIIKIKNEEKGLCPLEISNPTEMIPALVRVFVQNCSGIPMQLSGSSSWIGRIRWPQFLN